MRASVFSPITPPLVVTVDGEQRVMLAYAISTGNDYANDPAGELVCMLVPFAGGKSEWVSESRIEYPSPIRQGPVENIPGNRAQRRAKLS